jgi:chromosome segregation and condensation protein ScpB
MEPLDDALLKSEIDAIMGRVSGVMKRLKERGLTGEEQDGADSARPREACGNDSEPVASS